MFDHGQEVLPAEDQSGCIKANLMLEVSDKKTNPSLVNGLVNITKKAP